MTTKLAANKTQKEPEKEKEAAPASNSIQDQLDAFTERFDSLVEYLRKHGIHHVDDAVKTKK